jgi:hypothetical protein
MILRWSISLVGRASGSGAAALALFWLSFIADMEFFGNIVMASS